MTRRSFMSARAGEAAKELGRKSSTPEGAKLIFDGFSINIARVSVSKGDDVKVANAIIRSLFEANAGLWATIFQYKDVTVKGDEIQIPLYKYEIKGEKKPLIATLTCAKYIAAILRAAKTLDLLKSEITGKTVTADSSTFTVYFASKGVENTKEPSIEKQP